MTSGFPLPSGSEGIQAPSTVPIAPDAFADGGINYGGLSQTWAHTCGAGSAMNGLLLVACYGDSTITDISGVTYNGVAMSLHGTPILLPYDDRYFYLFYLYGPAAGTHNVVVSAAVSTVISGQSASYLNVSQSGFPDAGTTNTSASASTLSGTVTTVAPGAWTFICAKTAGATPTVTTGTQRLSSGATNLCMGDSGGPLAPGSDTLAMSNSTPAPVGLYVVSLAP